MTSTTVRLTRVAIVTLALTLGAFTVRPANAQPFDHLACYRIQDSMPHGISVADLIPEQIPPFDLEPGCTIAHPADFFCVDVIKTHVDPPPPLPIGGKDTRDFLCYRVRCGKDTLKKIDVADQFGKRTILVRQPRYLCAPAIKVGQPTPTPRPTVTPTSTPKPKPTQTPTEVPCKLDDLTEVCAGVCENPNDKCLFDPTSPLGCRCTPPEAMCIGTADGVCQGLCPNPKDLCLPVSGTFLCDCLPVEPPCTADANGVCNGFCTDPTTQCLPIHGGCDCLPSSGSCVLDDTGQCGGTCTLATEKCVPDPTGAKCACQSF